MPWIRWLATEGGHTKGDELEVTENEARRFTALDVPGGPKAIIVDDAPIDLPKGF